MLWVNQPSMKVEYEALMKLAVVVHEAEECGYWADVPAISGCVTQGESFEELLTNLHEAVDGCPSVILNEVPRTV